MGIRRNFDFQTFKRSVNRITWFENFQGAKKIKLQKRASEWLTNKIIWLEEFREKKEHISKNILIHHIQVLPELPKPGRPCVFQFESCGGSQTFEKANTILKPVVINLLKKLFRMKVGGKKCILQLGGAVSQTSKLLLEKS